MCKAASRVSLHLWLLCGCAAQTLVPGGTATQSSSHPDGPASNAIDGNRDSNFRGRSCTHTDFAPRNWWSLVLPDVYRISSIKITNRLGDSERINNAAILVGNSLDNNGNNNPRCAVISSIPAGSTETYNCRGMIGRVVNVDLNGTDTILTLCEVEVYGDLAPPSPSFSAVVMGRNVEVVQRKLSWSDAVFYCRDYYWDLLSIRNEEEQRAVEGVLKDATFTLTEHVWLGLRRYLMGSTWFWMSGNSMDYTHWETETTWQITSPCGGMDTSDPFHWRDLPCHGHFYFICLKEGQLDKERVEFFSSTRP